MGLNPSVLRTPPLYFAVQNTEEEFKSNPPFIADSIISFYCFCFNPLALRALPLYSLTETQGERFKSGISCFGIRIDFILLALRVLSLSYL